MHWGLRQHIRRRGAQIRLRAASCTTHGSPSAPANPRFGPYLRLASFVEPRGLLLGQRARRGFVLQEPLRELLELPVVPRQAPAQHPVRRQQQPGHARPRFGRRPQQRQLATAGAAASTASCGAVDALAGGRGGRAVRGGGRVLLGGEAQLPGAVARQVCDAGQLGEARHQRLVHLLRRRLHRRAWGGNAPAWSYKHVLAPQYFYPIDFFCNRRASSSPTPAHACLTHCSLLCAAARCPGKLAAGIARGAGCRRARRTSTAPPRGAPATAPATGRPR
jgi:hypothetical protein